MAVMTKPISPIIARSAIDEYDSAMALTLEEVDTKARFNSTEEIPASLSHESPPQRGYLEMGDRNVIDTISFLINTQASTAMLAQANQSKQSVLARLR